MTSAGRLLPEARYHPPTPVSGDRAPGASQNDWPGQPAASGSAPQLGSSLAPATGSTAGFAAPVPPPVGSQRGNMPGSIPLPKASTLMDRIMARSHGPGVPPPERGIARLGERALGRPHRDLLGELLDGESRSGSKPCHGLRLFTLSCRLSCCKIDTVKGQCTDLQNSIDFCSDIDLGASVIEA